jgi:hypothetical protein
VALKCARERLGEVVAGHFRIGPRYFNDPLKGLRLLTPAQVAEWLQDGLFHLLLGTLVLDVVLHATHEPLKVQAIYDFKFPCPLGPPRWPRYDDDSPFAGKLQGRVYHEVLGGARPAMVAPQHGITR